MPTSLAKAPPGRWCGRLVLFLFSLLWAGIACAEPARFALVIGNAGYANAPLPNAQNDAAAVAKVLERAGFKVDLKLNASQKQMQEAIAGFGSRLERDGIGLFYFAGHGVQIRGHNYLVPVSAEIRREDEPDEAKRGDRQAARHQRGRLAAGGERRRHEGGEREGDG